MAAIKALLGENVSKKGETKSVDDICGSGKVVGLYFSAHWCPPCRGFTPKLVDFYNNMKAKGKDFEIVFISSDRDEDAFNEYYGEMPWLALPYNDRDKKNSISGKYGVRGIPTFILLDGETGEIINANARGSVESDKEGTSFPWKQSS